MTVTFIFFPLYPGSSCIKFPPSNPPFRILLYIVFADYRTDPASRPRFTHPNQNPCALGGMAAPRLRRFKRLQGLQLTLPDSDSQVLSSTTSGEFRGVAILAGKIGVPHGYSWVLWLMTSCEPVVRLRRMGHRHALDAKLRFRFAEDGVSGINFTAFLPQSGERGIVTIADGSCDRILRSSIRYLRPLALTISTYMNAVHESVGHHLLVIGPKNEPRDSAERQLALLYDGRQKCQNL